MALVLRDRVKETTTTTGTATYTLAGAVAGFETFGSVGDGNTTYYACSDGTDFEVGIGTYTASGTTLARTTILQSSNSDAAVNWGSGTRTIFCTLPAEKMMFLNADGDFGSDLTLTSTDAGASNAPILTLYRNSASPADADDLGQLLFKGRNDASQDVEYAKIWTEIADASDGTEDTRLKFQIVADGSTITPFEIKQGAVYVNATLNLTTGDTVRFEGATANDFETVLSVTDPTADRTVSLPDATGTVLLTDGSGASLTALNASQLSSGTVPNARLDAQLQDVAGLATTDGGFIVGDGSNFVLESGATARTSLGLGSAATSNTTDFDAAGEAVALAIALG